MMNISTKKNRNRRKKKDIEGRKKIKKNKKDK